MRARSVLGCTAVFAALAAALVLSEPPPPVAPGALAGWLTGAEPADAVARMAVLASWCCLGWLTLALAVTALSALPGTTGRLARAAARRVAPAALHGALGLTVVALPIAASWPALAWADDTAPAPRWTPPSLDRPVPRTAAPQPATDIAVPPTYVVRRGDCLWSIARGHLGVHPRDSDVAATWPRWYVANRRVLGTDPDLIRAGQRLTVPQADSEVSR